MWLGVDTLMSGALGGWVGAYAQYLFSKRAAKKAEEERQRLQLNSALVALEDTRVSLLVYYNQHIIPAKEEARKELTDKSAQDLLMAWNTLPLRDYFKIFPFLGYASYPYPEKLDFVSLEKAPYLIVFHKLMADLDAINQQIRDRNKHIDFYMQEETEKDAQPSLKLICATIGLLGSSIENLDILINTALVSMELGVKYINEYAKLMGHKLSPCHLPINYKWNPNEEIKRFMKGFDVMIQGAINPKKPKPEEQVSVCV